MADSFTPTLNLTKPEINQSINTWGNKLNGDMDLIDQFATETNAQLEDHKDRLDAAEPFLVPAGGIIMWSGAENAIPTGWALCDGTQGTPNLRDKFVVSSGPTRAVGSTGGADSQTVATTAAGAHAHTGATAGHAITEAQMPYHQHAGATSVVGNHQHAVNGIAVVGIGGWAPPVGGSLGPGVVASDGGGEHAHSFATDFRGGSQVHAHGIFTDGSHAHNVTVPTVPAYYALAFIMKKPAA